eukprot:5510204-Prymnesium_polylepis.1
MISSTMTTVHRRTASLTATPATKEGDQAFSDSNNAYSAFQNASYTAGGNAGRYNGGSNIGGRGGYFPPLMRHSL